MELAESLELVLKAVHFFRLMSTRLNPLGLLQNYDQVFWPMAGSHHAFRGNESSLVARAISVLNRPPGKVRDRPPELATLNTPPSSCKPASSVVDGLLLRPPIVPSQSTRSCTVPDSMLVDPFAESLSVEDGNTLLACQLLASNASMQAESTDQTLASVNAMTNTIVVSGDVSGPMTTNQANVHYMPEESELSMVASASSTGSCQQYEGQQHAGRIQDLDVCPAEAFHCKREATSSHTADSFILPQTMNQCSDSTLFSPSTASETSLATNEDWFAMIDIADMSDAGVPFGSVFDGNESFGPLFAPSVGSMLSPVAGLVDDQTVRDFDLASTDVTPSTAALATLSAYKVPACLTSRQTSMDDLSLDSSALAQINSATNISGSISTTRHDADVMNSAFGALSRNTMESAEASRKTTSAAKETVEHVNNAQDPSAMEISFEVSEASSDGETIVASLERTDLNCDLLSVQHQQLQLQSQSCSRPQRSMRCQATSLLAGGFPTTVGNSTEIGSYSTTRGSKPSTANAMRTSRSKPSPGTRLMCHHPGCTKTFSSQHNLNEHQQVHEFPRVQRYFCREGECALSARGFNFKRDRTRHWMQKHPWVVARLKQQAAEEAEARRVAMAREKAEQSAQRARARAQAAKQKADERVRSKREKQAARRKPSRDVNT